MSDMGVWVSLVSVGTSLIATAYNVIRGGGVDKQKAASLGKDMDALKVSVANMMDGLTSFKASQTEFNKWSERDRTTLKEDFKDISKQINTMEGREDGREHREKR